MERLGLLTDPQEGETAPRALRLVVPRPVRVVLAAVLAVGCVAVLGFAVSAPAPPNAQPRPPAHANDAQQQPPPPPQQQRPFLTSNDTLTPTPAPTPPTSTPTSTPTRTTPTHARLSVACVGDSITFGNSSLQENMPTGYRPPQRMVARGSYPLELARLGAALNPHTDFGVRMFAMLGVEAMTADHAVECVVGQEGCDSRARRVLPRRLCATDRARAATCAFRDGLAYQQAVEDSSDVVVLMLGTNDAKRSTNAIAAHFANDLEALVHEFAAKATTRRVLLVLPPPAGDRPALDGLVRPLIRQVAAANASLRVGLVDVVECFGNRASELMGVVDGSGDGLHPVAEGSRVIARCVYAALATDFGLQPLPPEH